jgi:glycosyltransferase involved in cell wall biosynthesis
MKNLKHILIIEPEVLGHQPDYIRVLISFFNRQRNNVKLIFLVSSGMLKRLTITKNIKNAIKEEKLKFITLSAKETAGCLHKILWIRAFYRWFIAIRYCRRFKIDHIHFLFLDHIQLPLALRMPIPKGVNVSGILFRPSIHYKEAFGNLCTLKEKIRDVRKYILYSLMLKNSRVSEIFSLDKFFVSYAGKHLPDGEKLHYLPDPCLMSSKDRRIFDQFRMRKNLLPQKRKKFLLFGALDERKGIFATLDALALLEDRVSREIEIVFAGQLQNGIRGHFLRKVSEYLRLHKDGARLCVKDRYFLKNELIQLLKNCDGLLIPYQRHVGSSGLLFWAASANKPLITQDFGLIGYLVKKYKLGQAVDTSQSAEIAEAIQRFVDEKKAEENSVNEDRALLLKEHSPDEFSKKFFDLIFQHC